MGKPYAKEMARLADTYQWSLTADIASLVRATASTVTGPLVAVASGGSLSAAFLAALLHQHRTPHIARVATPLEAMSFERSNDAAFLIFSAGGRNTDVLNVFRHLVVREPRSLAICTGLARTPLSDLARGFRHVDNIELAIPGGKDGFLATNSLLAFWTVLIRAYDQIFCPQELPANLVELVAAGTTANDLLRELRQRARQLWDRDNLVVLHGPTTQPAAVDLESRFTEAALGTVQFADYRHFAHGRHHWLAKRGSSSAVLAFVTDGDRELADRTLRLIPKSIPALRIDLSGRLGVSALAGLVYSIHLAGLAGEARGIDPGRPGVPDFGRKIYNLKGVVARIGRREPFGTASATTAIARKLLTTANFAADPGAVSFWREAYEDFVRELSDTEFTALVLDYDGTMCDGKDRFRALNDEVAAEIDRLAKAGVDIGIATGRGRSVGEALRTTLPKAIWKRLLVGYYNCGIIAPLAEKDSPLREAPTGTLSDVANAIEADRQLMAMVTCEPRRHQVSLTPRSGVSPGDVFLIANEIVQRAGAGEISLVCSSHAIDVLGPGVSKQAILARFRNDGPRRSHSSILCMGDRGRWPGNDQTLLSASCSLSVDEVSTDPRTCWNLAPPGHRGVQALCDYLRALMPSKGRFRVNVAQIGRNPE